MKKKLLLFHFILLSAFISPVMSQTGPAGVLTSATNVLWLDANVNVVVTGSAVTSWTDRSIGRVASPNAAANRPALVTGSVNTNSSINFDGTDDELRIPDVAALDLTAWHWFIVVKVDVQKNYNAWMVKGDDNQENYEILSFNDGNIHTPTRYTDGSRVAPSSAGGQATTTEFNVIEYSYTAGGATIRGRNIFKNGTNIYADATNLTPTVNALPLYIGNERSTAGRFVDGDIAEIILYNAPLNAARRNIINNYLAAKYNLATATDLYVGDTPGNGNYDFEVGGLGQAAVSGKYVAGDNQSVSSAVTGGLEITESATQFDDGEYLIYGHQTGANFMNYTDIVGMSAGPLVGRWNRIWYLDWTNVTAAPAENVNMIFDVSDAGMVAVPSAPLSNYKLLYRAGLTGAWTEVMNASGVAGDRITFNNIAYTQGDGYYTIGTLDNTISPLPVELLNFSAHLNNDKVDVAWTTATEINNDYFTIQKSRDGQIFEDFLKVDGAGNSTSIISYFEIDQSPYRGISYYRLMQTDFNGHIRYSNIVPVENNPDGDPTISLFPNPAESNSPAYLELNQFEGQEVLVVLRDIQGREVYSKVIITLSNNELVALNQEGNLSKGTYLITASSANKLYSKKLIVK